MEKPFIDFKKLKINDHAVLRAKERFKRTDKKDSLQFAKSILGHANYLGESTCEKGNKAHMFALNSVVVFVSLDLTTVVTIMKIKDKSYIVKAENNNVEENNQLVRNELNMPNRVDHPLRQKLVILYQTESRKYVRTEKSCTKNLNKIKLEFGLELAELKYREYKTRSQAVKNACTARIAVINKYIEENENQIKNVQSEHRQIQKVLATLIV